MQSDLQRKVQQKKKAKLEAEQARREEQRVKKLKEAVALVEEKSGYVAGHERTETWLHAWERVRQFGGRELRSEKKVMHVIDVQGVKLSVTDEGNLHMLDVCPDCGQEFPGRRLTGMYGASRKPKEERQEEFAEQVAKAETFDVKPCSACTVNVPRSCPSCGRKNR